MNKKIFMLLFLMLALISVSAVSAADLDDGNETIAASDNWGGELSIANDVDAIDDTNKDDAGSDDNAFGKDALSVAGSENNEIYALAYDWGVTGSESETIYVNASAPDGGIGTEDSPYNNLKSALDNAQDDYTIMIASGMYKGTKNTGISFSKNLNFIKYGDGEAIFDAEKLRRIWTVTATSINITGLTFINGKAVDDMSQGCGGAIYFTKSLTNSNINATFINNTADWGGAVYIDSSFAGNLAGSFINNEAIHSGGAVYIQEDVSGKLAGSFIKNTADWGGAIYSAGGVSGKLAGSFINNTANDGGAIYFKKTANTNISGTFINNEGDFGGAITFFKNLSNININGTFINNTATDGHGGAILFQWDVSNLNINGTFINNTANLNGGAIHLDDKTTNTNISGTYINNTALYNEHSSIISFNNELINVNIANSIFLNNNASFVIYAKYSGVVADNNWFGNNATNYMNKPDVNDNVEMNNWLFLNATADPSELEKYESSTITFKLYNKNSPDVVYNSSKMNISLNLDQTLGELDKTAALLGEEITYTAKNRGDATVTGTFETASYTVNLKNNAKSIYVNSSAASGGDGKSESTAFQTLKEALDVAEDDDIILIASGTYTGENNTGLTINKNLSFEKYGDGEAIFDAEKQWRIWYVKSGTININGLTFKNGKSSDDNGGALFFWNPLSNSNINAVFINNNAKYYGGAIIFVDMLTNVSITGYFADNAVKSGDGGAIYFVSFGSYDISISGEFRNNSASDFGGAIYFYDVLNNVDITGNFTDNIAGSKGGAIYCRYEVSNSNINASFINNTATDGYGGANYFNDFISDSNIDGTYIGNKAKDGGANYFKESVSDSNISGTYINNTAINGYGGANYFYVNVSNSNITGTYDGNNAYNGGANYFYGDVSNSIVSGTYVGNNANVGGANYFDDAVSDSNITGTYINNTARDGSIIFFDPFDEALLTNVIISDAVFLNNDYNGDYNVIYASKTGVTATNNWFGNNATNYMDSPDVNDKVEMDNWLFLNATADPSELDENETSTIIFELYYMNSPDVVYDASKMNIRLNLDQTRGELDKTAALLGEEITYTAKNGGDASVTGTFETASYAINLHVSQIPTELNITVNYPDVYNPVRNFLVSGQVINKGTQEGVNNGSVDIYLNGEFKLTINVDDEGSFRCDLGPLDAGTYELLVKYYDGVGKFDESEWTGNYTINKANTTIDVPESPIEIIIGEGADIGAVLSPSEAGNLSYSSDDVVVAGVDENGYVTAIGAGTATITVSFEGSKNYAAAESKTVTVIVNKIPTELNISVNCPDVYNPVRNFLVSGQVINKGTQEGVNNGSADIYLNGEFKLTINVDDEGSFRADLGPLDAGTYELLVKYHDDTGKFNESEWTGNYGINRANTTIDVSVSSIEMLIGEGADIGAVLSPSEAGNLSYSSNDTTIATVDENGDVTAMGEGTATITVSFEGSKNYAAAESKTVTVTVNIIPTELNVTVNYPETYNPVRNFLVTGQVINKGTQEGVNNGSADIYLNGEFKLTINVDDEGVFRCDLGPLGAGTYELLVKYHDDTGKFNESEWTGNYTINKANATIDVSVSSIEMLIGESANIGAVLSPSEAGNLSYSSDDVAVVVVDENGDVTAMGEGTATITVSFEGNNNYTAAESKTVTVTVNIIPTELNVTVNYPETYNPVRNFLVTGQVTYKGKQEGVNNGSADIYLNGDFKLTINVGDEGVFRADLGPLGAGTYELLVKYHDDTGKFNESEWTGDYTINKANTVLDVTAETVTYGENLIVEVTGPFDISRRVTVTVGDESKLVSLKDGVGSVKFSGLDAGTYTVEVSYNGDANYSKSSANTTAKVNKATPTLKATAKAIAYGEDLVVEVKAPSDLARRVAVTIDGNITKYVTLTDGASSVKFKGLGVGVHTIEISYNGDENYKKASINKTVRVNRAVADIKIKAPSVSYGDDVVVNITMPSDVTRRVKVVIGGNITKTVSLKEGIASVKFSDLGVGVHTIEVTYDGDSNYLKSTANKTVRVNRATPDIQVTANDITEGETLVVDVQLPADVTRRAEVTVAGETKAVSLKNGTGSAKFTGLEAGTYDVAVSYNGDSNYKAATNSTTVNVK